MSPRNPPASDRLLALNEEVAPSAAVQLQATDSMCHHCFDVLLEELKGSKRKGRNQSFQVTFEGSNRPEFAESLSDDGVECPLFVTWDKRKHPPSRKDSATHDSYELRGCIGTLAPKPLVSSIGEYALISALRDRRFHPVSLSEFPTLRVSVSLLVQYEECDHCHDWSVGIHGIIIRWMDHSKQAEFSATYLPEVASEQGWDQVVAVSSLIRKAGYHGSITEDLLQKIQCTRYQSSKQKVTFDEYMQCRGHDPSSLLRLHDGDTSNDGVRKQKAATSRSPASDCRIQ